MVKLNLLPEKVRAAELLRYAIFGGIAVYGLLILILVWRFFVAAAAVGAVEDQIKAVEAELAPLKSVAEEVKKLSTEKTEQEAKKSKIGELAKRQAYLVRVMDLVPDLMLGGQIWLRELDQMVKGPERRIVLDGYAVSMEAWADFYNNLESQYLVSDIKIETSPTVVVEGSRKIYQFKVSFLLKEAL